MINILIYLAIFYLVVNVLGFFLEKIRIPRIYAALFLGIALSMNMMVVEFVNFSLIRLLINAGMFFLLFLLGLSINLGEIKRQKKLIVRTTFWVILSEAVVGTLILHLLFSVDWLLAGIISISFATVGEVALLPILKEFKLTETRLGQTILGVSILDDVIEIVVFLLIIVYMGSFQAAEIVTGLIPLTAIFLGIIANNITKNSKAKNVKMKKIATVLALTIFGPLFFFYAGTEANINIILNNFLLIIFLTLVIKSTKITSAYFASRKQLGTKKSIILGISLSIKFSTSIIILIILLQKNLISEELFSVLIGIKVSFKFIVPILLSYLLTRWHSDIFTLEENIVKTSKT